jgi:hypothetical protein
MAQGTTKGVPIDIDPLLVADSDLLVPSQKAVKSYAQPQLNGTGFVKTTGTTISYDNSTYLTSVGTGVTNELTYWSGTNTIGSLATATYPSLTELSYVKGVTSGIQTQLNSKVYSLSFFSNAWTVVAGTTYYIGNFPRNPATTAGTSRVYIPKAGTITDAIFSIYSAGVAGSNNTMTVSIRLNNTTDYLIEQNSTAAANRNFTNNSLSIPVVVGDYIEIKIQVATPYTTVPTNNFPTANVLIRS